MRLDTRIFFAAVLAALTLLPGSLLAQDESAEERTKDVGRGFRKVFEKARSGDGEYAAMVSQVDPTDEQEDALKSRFRERNERLAEWDEEHRKEINDAADRLRDADGRRQREAAWDDLKRIRERRREVADREMAHVLDVLTRTQREKWDAYRLNRDARKRFEKLDLTDDQEDAIKTRSRITAKDLAEMGVNDTEARRERQHAFYRRLREEVLTRPQDEKYEKVLELRREQFAQKLEEKPGSVWDMLDDIQDEF